MRVAIYARVSTQDKGQDTENQLIQLRDYVKNAKWTVTKEYIDHTTGKHGDRAAFKLLFQDASKRMFDCVLVWALDRFTREGVLETFEYIRDLTKYGVQFESYSEAHFRTTGMAGELMLAISAWIAKQERLRISDRTKAGLERARRAGRYGGRPVHLFRRDKVVTMREAGDSWRKIADALGVPITTVRRSISNPPIKRSPARGRGRPRASK
jgi:DNA invertase Pin-like site-specific DNA recombinase